MTTVDLRTEIKEFLASRRARLTPEQAGLSTSGGRRRVEGLRRAEVAVLAGVSVEYYVRMERGSLAGVSAVVLEALASALHLDEGERAYLFHLAQQCGTTGGARRPPSAGSVRPALQQVLDAMVGAPAWIHNGRYDVLAMNHLARALYSPLLADPRRPANTARFVYLNPVAAREFFADYDQIVHDVAEKLRMEAGRNPHDKHLIALVGELATQSEPFRQRWASRDVQLHRPGRKRVHHPVVGQLDLDVETMQLSADPGLHMTVYTAPVGTPAADSLTVLASWAASEEENLPTEIEASS